MKVIITGCRGFYDEDFIRKAIEAFPFLITEVVSKGADGVDSLGEDLANEHGIPVKFFAEDWAPSSQGTSPRVNTLMTKYADSAIVIYDGQTPEFTNLIEQMKKLNKPVYVHLFERKSK